MSSELVEFIPMQIDGQDTFDFLSDALTGIGLFDLERFKVPGGGSKSFNVASFGEDTEVKEFKAVILLHKPIKNYYEVDYAGGSERPDCSSNDGITGVGEPGGLCEDCPLGEIGSDQKTGGKMCKDKALLIFLQPGTLLPSFMIVPTMSLKPLQLLKISLASKGKKFDNSIIRFWLEKQQNSKGQGYSRLRCESAGSIDPKTKELTDRYALLVKAIAK